MASTWGSVAAWAWGHLGPRHPGLEEPPCPGGLSSLQLGEGASGAGAGAGAGVGVGAGAGAGADAGAGAGAGAGARLCYYISQSLFNSTPL